MKKGKKLFAIAVSSVLALSVLAGCGNQPIDTGLGTITKEELDPKKIGDYSSLKLPLDKKGTTISAIADTNVTTNNESVVVKELRRRTGVNLQIVAIPRATIKEKAKVMLASKKDMPDIFSGGFTFEEVNDLGMQGAFEPITAHIDDLPNLKKIFYDEAEQHKTVDKLKGMTAADGNVYIFPTYDINRDVNHGMLYRKDIFDKHGLTMWNNEEEYYQTLKKLKELYPNSTPMVSKTQTIIFRDMGYSWGLNGFSPYYDETDKTWKLSSTDPKYREMLNFLKKLYDEGLLDPEFLTATQASWTAKMTQADKAFVTWDWIGRLDMFKEQTANTVPTYDLRYANPLRGKVISLPNVTGGPAIKKSENSLLAMQVLDYLISESGARLMSMGIEGQTYEVGENGFAKYYGFEEGQAVGIDALEEKYGMFISGVYRRFDRKSTYYNFTEREKEAQDLMLNKEDGFMPEDPAVIFNNDEKAINTQYVAGLIKAGEEFSTQYILGNKNTDADWNAWLEKAKTLGADQVIKAYNDAQARFDAM